MRRGLLGIATRPTDRPDERLKKEALVLTSVAITVLATFWVGTYLLVGQPLAAAVPFAYQVVSILGLIYVARTGDFEPYKISQIGAMLVLPFLGLASFSQLQPGLRRERQTAKSPIWTASASPSSP